MDHKMFLLHVHETTEGSQMSRLDWAVGYFLSTKIAWIFFFGKRKWGKLARVWKKDEKNYASRRWEVGELRTSLPLLDIYELGMERGAGKLKLANSWI